MNNTKIKFGVSVATFAKGLTQVSKALEGAWLPSNHDWSSSMAERIDVDNRFHLGSPFFARKLDQLPKPIPVNIATMMPVVELCYMADKNVQFHQHLKFKEITVEQMKRCGFAVDFEDEDGHINFSRWLAADSLQLCRIEFL